MLRALPLPPVAAAAVGARAAGVAPEIEPEPARCTRPVGGGPESLRPVAAAGGAPFCPTI